MVVEGEQATLPQLLFNLVKYCREYFQPNATLGALVRNWLQIMFCSTNVLQGRPVDAASMLQVCKKIDDMTLDEVMKVAQELSEVQDKVPLSQLVAGLISELRLDAAPDDDNPNDANSDDSDTEDDEIVVKPH